MHACGHDTHTAMLARRRRLLSARRDEIPGRVLFMFQPGEEGEHGAQFMLDEGLLDVPPLADGTPSPVTGAFALHITSTIPTGMVATKGGPTMASADTFQIVVHGAGGHASEPFRSGRPDPDRMRDRAGAAADGDATDRHLRPGRRDRRADHRRHHQQHHPRHGDDRRHDPHRQRAHPRRGARQPPARRRTDRRSARGHGRTGDHRSAIRSRRTTTSSPTSRSMSRPRRARRRQRAPHAQPDHGCRGLLVRAPARARHDDVPRRHRSRPRRRAQRRPTTPTWSCSTRTAMVDGVTLYSTMALRHLGLE